MNDGDKPIKLTLFHMDGCNPCAQFRPTWDDMKSHPMNNICFEEYERADIASMSGGMGTINGKDIAGFPTIKVSILKQHYDYKGNRTQPDILEFIRNKLKNKSEGIESESDSNDDGSRQTTTDEVNFQMGGSKTDLSNFAKSTSNSRESIFSKSNGNNSNQSTMGGRVHSDAFKMSEFDRLLSKKIDFMSDGTF
jgi:hypothetical protein